MSEPNILTIDSALEQIVALRALGKKIVSVSGTFDLLHEGHRALIDEAGAQGDALFVLVNSDVSVKKYKGPMRPIQSQHERALQVASLEGVTGVVIFDDINPISLLELLRPDIYVNGSDWGENCIERPTVEAYGGKIYVVKRGAVSTASTTEIISSHPEHHEEKPVRAVFVDRDGVIVEDVGYLHEVENVRILPQAITGLQEMQNQGFLLFIVTNQSGVGRGKFPATDMHAVNLFIVEELAKNGVYVKKVYHCPHVEEDHCECRKPKVGLLLKAVEEYGVVLEKSYLIGDKSSDIECGRFANAKTIFIENGLYLYASSILPHFRAKNLLEASQYVK